MASSYFPCRCARCFTSSWSFADRSPHPSGTVAPTVLGMIGERVTLPCSYEEGGRWQVSDLRVLWQTATDLVVHAQYGAIEENDAQESRYRNRTSLVVGHI
eukprot:g22611.t1